MPTETHTCQDCKAQVDPDDVGTCVVCGCEVCLWCLDGRVCHECLDEEEEAP